MLDRNGYAPSILQGDSHSCYICERTDKKLDRHEVFGGANRQKSKRLGLWVLLCHSRCHQGISGVHLDKRAGDALKREAQRVAMERFNWTTDDFIREIGKNYLD